MKSYGSLKSNEGAKISILDLGSSRSLCLIWSLLTLISMVQSLHGMGIEVTVWFRKG